MRVQRRPNHAQPASSNARSNHWFVLALIGLLLFDVWWRGHTFGPTIRDWSGLRLWPVVEGETEPLDCDEAVYAYIGRRIADGAVMYRDLHENKPPLGYWLYAVTVALGGAEEITIRVMPIPVLLLTITLLAWIGRVVAGSLAGMMAGMAFVLLSTDPYLFGNGANMESFLNALSVASLAAFVHWVGHGTSSSLAWSGACVAAATLIKPIALIQAVPYCVVVLWYLPIAKGATSLDRKQYRSVRALGTFALGFAVPSLIALAIILAQGTLANAFQDAFLYGKAMATDVRPEPNQPPIWLRWLVGNADPHGRLPWPFGSTDYLVWWGAGSWPLWLAGTIGLVGLCIPPEDRLDRIKRRLLAAWTVMTGIEVLLPGLYWPHYYLLATPGMALAVGVMVADGLALVTTAKRRGLRVLGGLAMAVGLLAISLTGWIQVRDYLMVPPEQLTTRYKGGGQWIALREIGRAMKRGSEVWNDPHLYIWGIQSPLYFYSGLDGVTPQVFADNLIRDHADSDHPLIRPRIEATMRDLHAKKPELIFAGYPPFAELRRFLGEHYVPTRLRMAGRPLAMPGGMGLWLEPRRADEFEREMLQASRLLHTQ